MRRAAKIKTNREVGENWELKNSSSKRKERTKEDLKSLEYLNLGFYVIVPLLLGVFVGYQVDKYFKTNPFFVILGIAFGTVSTFYNLWKILHASYKH